MAIEQIVFTSAKQEWNGGASQHQKRHRCNSGDTVPAIDQKRCTDRADCEKKDQQLRSVTSVRGHSIDAVTERTQQKERQFRWKETIGPRIAGIAEPELERKSQQQARKEQQRNASQRTSHNEGSEQIEGKFKA